MAEQTARMTMSRWWTVCFMVSLWCWTGMAEFELEAGYLHTCAVYQKQIKCIGWNKYGQLGLGHTSMVTSFQETPIDLGDDFLAASISCGKYYCASVSDAGAIKSWGYNGQGQLGYGDTDNRGDQIEELGNALPYVDVGFVVDHIAALYWGGVCAMSTDGDIKCFGANNVGQLGYGDTNNRGDEDGEMANLETVDLGAFDAVKLIEGGSLFICALSSDGGVKCWGSGKSGQLGQGTTDNIGDEVGEMGDSLPEIDLGSAFTTSVMRCGASHCCALSNSTGFFKCWGANTYGQLGYGDTDNRGDAINEMGDNLKNVDLGTGFIVEDFALSLRSTCAISQNDGEIKCFGGGLYGQLGYGDTANRGGGVGDMGDALPVVDVGTGFTAAGIHLAENGGSNHFCVYEESLDLEQILVKCWGYGRYGQLGYGDTTNHGDASGEMGETLPFVDLGTWPVVTTNAPTMEPTVSPTVQPTVSPTVQPTLSPTVQPTAQPSDEPTMEPTKVPTAEPTKDPTMKPTVSPTVQPTLSPTVKPTAQPSAEPTMEPTKVPTVEPTKVPTMEPTVSPTMKPTPDCSVFHIDEFLMDCSDEFDAHDAHIDTLNSDVASIKETVSKLVNATATTIASINAINAEIQAIMEQLDGM